MMRKRKTVVAKRITPKVMTGIPKTFGILNDPLGNQVESRLMEKEEADQRRYDRFWGQDKDLQDRELERYRMADEDTASLANEKWYETVEIHRRWDEEYQRNLWFENRSQAKYKEIERREYLKFVNSSLSSDEVINFVWGGKTVGGGLHSVAGESSARRDLIFSDLSAINREVALSLPATVGALHMSVHLDGLQQAKAIVDEASTAFKQTLRRINNQTALDGDAAQPFKTNTLAAAIIKKKGNAGSVHSPGTKKNQAATADAPMESSVLLEVEPPRPIAAIEGHALHKWDQELMLQLAFMGLDKGGKGYLAAEEVAGVSFDAKTHSLLSFTVFWANIKKRQWSFFQCMSSNNAPPVSSASASANTTVKAGITLSDWMAAAERLSAEEAVPLRHIRTHEEHVRISEGSSLHHHSHNNNNSSGGRPPLLSRGAGAANVFSGLPEREHRVSRHLAVGDVVWALHHGGVLWLPAVLRAVHFQPPLQQRQQSSIPPSGHSSTVTYSDYRYDLWFPISQKELLKARSAMAARQLLALPSQQAQQSQSQYPGSQVDQAPSVPPKPLSEERHVCAYAFDLVDSGGEGIVQLPRLVQCLQSREFSRVVATSLALSTIFHGGSRVRSVDVDHQEGNNEGPRSEKDTDTDKERAHGAKLAAGTADIPSLLPVFIDTFSAPSAAAAGVSEELAMEEEEEEVEIEVEEEEQLDGEEEASYGVGVGAGGESASVSASHSMTLLSSDTSVNAADEIAHNNDNNNDNDNNDNNDNNENDDGMPSDRGEDGKSRNSAEKAMTTTNKRKIKKIIKVKRAKLVPAPATAPLSPAGGARPPPSATDWISKLDFLEFCQAVVDVKRYSVCTQ